MRYMQYQSGLVVQSGGSGNWREGGCFYRGNQLSSCAGAPAYSRTASKIDMAAGEISNPLWATELTLLILFVSDELRFARWSEIDFETSMWTGFRREPILTLAFSPDQDAYAFGAASESTGDHQTKIKRFSLWRRELLILLAIPDHVIM
ncbi:hypothetical protein KCP78_22980 [Salmonella enterica subsp. enterica]|nr:hypothetical protein KCP78_22980 [Salmonella enterica subsp. enterica]